MVSELHVGRVQRFCLHDGPGIRTTVFLQGCPLRCWWCQNPELRAAPPEAGRRTSPEALADELLRDARYWRTSGGGVTLSGGEPLAQAPAAGELLRRLGEHGAHRCVETSLGAPAEAVETLLGETDLWLVDLKHADAGRLTEQTGLDMRTYRANLERVLASDAAVALRVPIIRGFSDADEDVRAMGRLAAGLPRALPLRILPGHDIGLRDGPPATVSREVCERARELLRAFVDDVEVLW
jgi:pyruvate formate lyase activating enzyme